MLRIDFTWVRTVASETTLVLAISREEVENSPDIDTPQPVSRRREREYFDYYGYPYYWGHAGLWGAHAIPMMPTPQDDVQGD